MMTMQGRVYQNCKFQYPQGLGSDVRRGHISHYSEYVLSSTLSIYSTLIAMMLLTYSIVDFYLFLDGAVDIQI